MSRPLCLDLFCGGGGASVGYHQAGFDVIGVDIAPSPRYPFPCVQADALEFLSWARLERFALIHASPPCQRYSQFSRNIGTAHRHPDLIAATRQALQQTGIPYVIENVPGAPLLNPIRLCGSMFSLQSSGMGLRRHRLFECSSLFALVPACDHREALSIGVYGRGTPQWHRQKLGRNVSTKEWAEAMGISWMTRDELAQAIPPAYCHFIGERLIACLGGQWSD